MLTWMVNRKRQLDLVNVVHPPVNPIEQQITRTRKGPCNASTAIRQHKQQQTTVVCIVGSGLSLATLGAVFVFIGTLYKSKSTPWYVAGATCIGVGLLVLLLSVETILKCRRSHIAMTNLYNSELGAEAGEDPQGVTSTASSSQHVEDGHGNKHMRRNPDAAIDAGRSGPSVSHSRPTPHQGSSCSFAT